MITALLIGGGLGWLLALCLRHAFIHLPGLRPGLIWLPWRSLLILSLLACNPSLLLALGQDLWAGLGDNFMSGGLLNGLTLLALTCRAGLLALMIMAITSLNTGQTEHWLDRAVALLRSLCLLAAGMLIELEQFSGSGLGSELIRRYMEFDNAGAVEVWRVILQSLLLLDLSLGALQLGLGLLSRSLGQATPASTPD
ncbi:hypothetical protein [Uliginosibacterium flavum]|uniref:hypothetical protein n=1 Tax=Uliginosibacterium flavum TaxID=1396831 RepID=UPI00339CEA4A